MHHVQSHGKPAPPLNIIKIKTRVVAEGAAGDGLQGQQPGSGARAVRVSIYIYKHTHMSIYMHTL